MMRKKLLGILLAAAVLAGSLGTAAFALTPNESLAQIAVSQIVADGVDTTFDGRTYRTRNNGPELGYDADGNAFIQTVDGGPCPVLHAKEASYMNGFSYTFKIQDKYSDKKLSDGANFDMAFYVTPGSKDYYSWGVNFVVGTNDKNERVFVAYLIEAGSIYRSELGDLIANHTNRDLKLPVGEEIAMEIKKMTSADLSAYFSANAGEKLDSYNGADRGTAAEGYFLFLNGRLVQWNLTTHNVYLFPDSPAHRLKLDSAKADYCFYLGVEMNTINATGGPTSVAVPNQDARLTVVESSFTGAETAPLAAFAEDDSYKAGAVAEGMKSGTVATGLYKDSKLYSGDGLSLISKTLSDLAGAGERAALKTAGETVRLYFKKTRTAGTFADGVYTDTDYFGVDIERITKTSAKVSVVSNGISHDTQFTAESPMDFNWRNLAEITFGAFVKNGKATLTLGGIPLVTDDVAVSFASGYFAVQADEGDSRMIAVSSVRDGSAARKLYASSVATVLDPKTIAVGESVPELPEKVKVKLDDGTEQEWFVTWDSSSVQTTLPGIYTVTGKFKDAVDLKELYYIPAKTAGALKVSVTVKQNVKTVTGFVKPADISIETGGAYDLGTSYEVTLDDGTKETIAVTWTGRVNNLKAGSYTLTATPPVGYEFASDVPVTVTVTVKEKTDEKPEKAGCASGSVGGMGFGLTGGLLALSGAVLLKRKKTN